MGNRVLEAIIQDLNNEMICNNKRMDKEKNGRKPEDVGLIYGLAQAKSIVEKWN